MRLLSVLVLLALALVVAGCDASEPAPTFVVEPGLLYLDGANGPDSTRIEVDGVIKSGAGVTVADGSRVVPGPAVVRAGVPVEVVVHTLGGLPTSYIPVTTEVRWVGRSAELIVRDSVRQGPHVLVLTHHPRATTLVFERPGPAEIVVRGIRNDVLEGRVTDYAARVPVEVRE